MENIILLRYVAGVGVGIYRKVSRFCSVSINIRFFSDFIPCFLRYSWNLGRLNGSIVMLFPGIRQSIIKAGGL